MICNFGDVILVPFPFTDQTLLKKRPAIIISSNNFNKRHRDVIVIAVTSQQRAASYPDNLKIQNWKQAGLLKPSVIKLAVTTLQCSLILRKLGTLDSAEHLPLQKLIYRIVG